MSQHSYLHSFRPVLPKYHLPQEKLIDWTLKAHQQSGGSFDLAAAFKFCLSPNHINERWFECPDVDDNWSRHEIYKLTPETPRGVPIQMRNQFFSQKCERIFKTLYEDASSRPDHLIHVTCTGYVSPSPAQIFFQSQDTSPAITHAYHMGCYASLPAVRMGRSLVGSKDFQEVDIVHTEMCSLHLDSHLHTPEQFVIQTLFADGHIAYRISSEKPRHGFRIVSIIEKLIPDSSGDMTWTPGDHGMMMSLSKSVPVKIRQHLAGFIDELCSTSGVPWQRLKSEGVFAIHPGGPKIIETIQRLLELSDLQVHDSHEILRLRGNMSSATLPHVWDRILKSHPEGTYVLSLAFGPGLTMFGAILEVV